MADLLHAPDLPSEDEEDEDYDPSADPTGVEDGAVRKQRGGAQHPRKRGPGQLSPADPGDSQRTGNGAHTPAEAADTAQADSKRAKVEQLWQQLNSGGKQHRPGAGSAQPTAVPATSTSSQAVRSGSTSLASLCKPISKAKDADKSWMAQLGLLPAKTTQAAKAEQPSGQQKSQASSAAALAAARAAAAALQAGKSATTEVRRFAGKDVQLAVPVGGTPAADKPSAEERKNAGLDAVLASLQTAKKANVLDKTRSDWSSFKATNVTLEEELESHKRSGDQFLDKKEFLQRAELRAYEKERDQRLASDVRNRGRL